MTLEDRVLLFRIRQLIEINTQPNWNCAFICVPQSECVLQKLIVKDLIRVLTMVVIESCRDIASLGEHDSNLGCFRLNEIEKNVHQAKVSIQIAGTDFLPFDLRVER